MQQATEALTFCSVFAKTTLSPGVFQAFQAKDPIQRNCGIDYI